MCVLAKGDSTMLCVLAKGEFHPAVYLLRGIPPFDSTLSKGGLTHTTFRMNRQPQPLFLSLRITHWYYIKTYDVMNKITKPNFDSREKSHATNRHHEFIEICVVLLIDNSFFQNLQNPQNLKRKSQSHQVSWKHFFFPQYFKRHLNTNGNWYSK